MSIIVNNLVKTYGQQNALNQISFEINKGDIVGLLGPNGAGKSTLMKIISGYIPATEGSVEVCSLDVKEASLEVKKNIGYLPEKNPLYTEMYVHEYLRMVASLHRINNAKQRVEEVIDLVGLSIEQHKKISMLSKGYKQRVGIAQALIHDPKVLILDEPISGLDPNQLVEIRSLFKSLGKDRVVLFSSHILQEVQALCDRVIIINQGNLIVDDSIDNIKALHQGNQIVECQFKYKPDFSLLTEINGIDQAEWDEKLMAVRIYCKTNEDIREAVFDFAVASNNKLLSLKVSDSSMEDIFQDLTQNVNS